MGSALPRRIAVAAIGIPTALGLVYLGGWFLVGILALLGAVGVREFYALAQRGGAKPAMGLGYVAALVAPVSAFVVQPAGGGLAPIWVGFGAIGWFLAVLSWAVLTLGPDDRPLTSVSATVFGPVYTGMPALLLFVRYGDGAPTAWAGTWLVFFPLVVIWICDSLAMAGGSTIGGPKLAPVISPNKTWSGATSGLVGAVLVAVGYGWMVLRVVGVSVPAWQLAIGGVLLGTLGQVGDLAESLFKRAAGVKDSGAFFPGHGGVLDRLDSLYWAIPIAAMFFYTIGVL